MCTKGLFGRSKVKSLEEQNRKLSKGKFKSNIGEIIVRDRIAYRKSKENK
jgi:hypothetical protein